MNELSTDYRGVNLKVTFDNTPSATLLVNNIERMQASSERRPCTLYLSSTVQTDYEWHEYIEADLKFMQDEVMITLRANSDELATETFPLETG